MARGKPSKKNRTHKKRTHKKRTHKNRERSITASSSFNSAVEEAYNFEEIMNASTNEIMVIINGHSKNPSGILEEGYIKFDCINRMAAPEIGEKARLRHDALIPLHNLHTLGEYSFSKFIRKDYVDFLRRKHDMDKFITFIELDKANLKTYIEKIIDFLTAYSKINIIEINKYINNILIEDPKLELKTNISKEYFTVIVQKIINDIRKKENKKEIADHILHLEYDKYNNEMNEYIQKTIGSADQRFRKNSKFLIQDIYPKQLGETSKQQFGILIAFSKTSVIGIFFNEYYLEVKHTNNNSQFPSFDEYYNIMNVSEKNVLRNGNILYIFLNWLCDKSSLQEQYKLKYKELLDIISRDFNDPNTQPMSSVNIYDFLNLLNSILSNNLLVVLYNFTCLTCDTSVENPSEWFDPLISPEGSRASSEVSDTFGGKPKKTRIA